MNDKQSREIEKGVLFNEDWMASEQTEAPALTLPVDGVPDEDVREAVRILNEKYRIGAYKFVVFSRILGEQSALRIESLDVDRFNAARVLADGRSWSSTVALAGDGGVRSSETLHPNGLSDFQIGYMEELLKSWGVPCSYENKSLFAKCAKSLIGKSAFKGDALLPKALDRGRILSVEGDVNIEKLWDKLLWKQPQECKRPGTSVRPAPSSGALTQH
ncbi:MAG: hypothetical protein PHE27_02030 [Alphaproteobacteria bacterium]|nr:hypothetical protein [Alphaproteobacteria bacterium]